MLSIIILVLQINFCGQKIDINTKMISCHKYIKSDKFELIKKFKNIEYLDLSNSNFRNLALLKKLIKLRFLSLENTSIKSLKDIESLKNIEELGIQNNEIKLTKLETLNLKYIYVNKIDNSNINIFFLLKNLLFIQTLEAFRGSLYHLGNNIYGLNRPIVNIYKMMKIKIYFISKIELVKNNRIDILVKKYLLKYNYMSKGLIYQILQFKIKENLFYNINRIDKLGNSPLDYALGVYNRYHEKFLIRTIYEEKYHNKELYRFLKEHGALKGDEILKIQKDTKKMINFILSLKLKEKILYLLSPFYNTFL